MFQVESSAPCDPYTAVPWEPHVVHGLHESHEQNDREKLKNPPRAIAGTV